MQEVFELEALRGVDELAVIINCGTKTVTTLALGSTLQNAGLPVLLVNCGSADGSRAHFAALAQVLGWQFFWIEWPLRPHGITLDRLFRELAARRILLVDSDVEIMTAEVVPALQQALAASEDAYGAGFLHGPEWMDERHGIPPQVGYYAQRMWIPLVLLRREPVARAVAQGGSFLQQREFTDLPGFPRLARGLGRRFWLPGLRHLRLRRAGQPAFIEYDTGARLHRQLQEAGRPFAEVDHAHWAQVRHFHGVTRATLVPPLRRLLRALGFSTRHNETAGTAVMAEIEQRLSERYGVDSK